MVPMHKQDHLLNEFQRNRLSVTCSYIDKLLKGIEEVLNSTASKSPFPKYIGDIESVQRRVIEDYIARLRAQLLRVLEGMEIPVPVDRISALHSVKTTLTFIDIAVEELKPKYMRGYGDVSATAQEALNGVVAELDGLIHQINTYLSSDIGFDFDKRLKILEALGRFDVVGLQKMEQIIAKYGLVEFRPALATIMDRLEDDTFEIAIFGKVSSGKSSLLNSILETDILPVGVTPITAIPTRIRVSTIAQLSVSIAGFGTQLYDVDKISDFVTEQSNPANIKRVAKLIVTLPSSKIKKGITFVDTPGLGSLASAGAEETMAYLPRCDYAIVLLDAGAVFNEGDLQLLHTLFDVGIPSSVLLSKSDLIDESQRKQLIIYAERQIEAALGIRMSVVPVSAQPQHQALLDSWYKNHLEPLFDQAAQLRTQSVARKIGSTRSALESTLRSFKKTNTAADQKLILQKEDTLRRFAGRFVQLKKDTHSIADRIASSLDKVLKEAVRRSWNFRNDADFADKIHDEIELLTNDFGTAIFAHIQRFVPDMVAELAKTAEAASSISKPTEQDFAGIARELPRFEAPLLSASDISKPSVAAIFGQQFAQNIVVKSIKESIGSSLSDNFSYYRTVLRSWVESVTTNLHASFDSFAELYRANLRREIDSINTDISQEEIEIDLKSLEQFSLSAA